MGAMMMMVTMDNQKESSSSSAPFCHLQGHCQATPSSPSSSLFDATFWFPLFSALLLTPITAKISVLCRQRFQNHHHQRRQKYLCRLFSCQMAISMAAISFPKLYTLFPALKLATFSDTVTYLLLYYLLILCRHRHYQFL